MRLDTAFKNIMLLTFATAFTAWGISGLLIAEIPKILNLDIRDSTHLPATFIMIIYGYTIVGGYISDRWITKAGAITLGVSTLLLGSLMACVGGKLAILLGISMIATGSAISEVVKLNIISNLYSQIGSERDKAFTICFAILNLGVAAGIFAYDYLSIYIFWQAPFIISAIINLGYLIISKNVEISEIETKPKKKKYVLYSLTLTILCSFLGLLSLYNVNLSNIFLWFFVILALGWFISLFFGCSETEKSNLLAIGVIVLSNLLFYSMFFQVYGTLAYCLQRNVDKNIWFLSFSESSLVAFITLAVIPLSYLVSKCRALDMPAKNKILVGLFLCSVSFICFGIMFYRHDAFIPFHYIIIPGIILALSEVFIAPPTSSAITKLAPEKCKGVVNGLSIAACSFGGKLSAMLGVALMDGEVVKAENFIFISAGIIGLIVIFLLLSRNKFSLVSNV